MRHTSPDQGCPLPPDPPERWQFGLRTLLALPVVIAFVTAGATGGLGKPVQKVFVEPVLFLVNPIERAHVPTLGPVLLLGVSFAGAMWFRLSWWKCLCVGTVVAFASWGLLAFSDCLSESMARVRDPLTLGSLVPPLLVLVAPLLVGGAVSLWLSLGRRTACGAFLLGLLATLLLATVLAEVLSLAAGRSLPNNEISVGTALGIFAVLLIHIIVIPIVSILVGAAGAVMVRRRNLRKQSV